MLFLLVACATQEGVNDSVMETGASDPWQTEVSARFRDAAHAFTQEGEAFVAESPGHGLNARFDIDGAWLTVGEDSIGVRVSSFGRESRRGALEPVTPTFGACVADMEEPGGDCVRRLEYAADGFTEWWISGTKGFEQGFSVAAPPDGDGDLTIDLSVDSANVVVEDGELWLDGDAGGMLRVSGLAAWDADGRVLAARFEAIRGGFRVRVDDAGARYPVEIDPVYRTAGTTLHGETTNSYFGYSVAGAGDVNGDGYDDVVVGAYIYMYNTTIGRAYVYLGSASGLLSTAATTLSEGAYYFGHSVAGAGDVNGDGYDDVVVGAPPVQLVDRPHLPVPWLGERPVEHCRDHAGRGNKRNPLRGFRRGRGRRERGRVR